MSILEKQIDNSRPGGRSVSINEQLPEKIRNLDLGPIKFKTMEPESHLGWIQEEADLAEEEYRKYLTLRFYYSEFPLPPDAIVDEFWHCHILDTHKYIEDCQTIFGKYLHHFPYFGIRGEEDAQRLQTAYQKCVELYKKHFGEPNQYFWQISDKN